MYGGGGAWQNVLSKISCIMYNETIVYKSIKCEVQQELMKQHIGQSLYAYREQCSDSVSLFIFMVFTCCRMLAP